MKKVIREVKARLEKAATVNEEFYSDLLSKIESDLKRIFGAAKVKEGKFSAGNPKGESKKEYLVSKEFMSSDMNKIVGLKKKHGLNEIIIDGYAKAGTITITVFFELND